jgi:choline dehydrogenase-like flavoprotein
MQPDYDVLIIGSGFGGSVSALRLTEKGYRVGVLEAGPRYADDEFAKTSWNLRKFLWMPKLGLYGIQRIHLLRNVMILAGAGVGGGSLNYANTLYVPQDPFFNDPQWKHITDWRAELMPHYDQAQRMLGVVKNPTFTDADRIVKEVADEMGVGDTFVPTPVGVFFGPDGTKTPGKTVPDPYFGGAGPDRRACTECGECMTGCRHGAKNTLETKLPRARRGGRRGRAPGDDGADRAADRDRLRRRHPRHPAASAADHLHRGPGRVRRRHLGHEDAAAPPGRQGRAAPHLPAARPAHADELGGAGRRDGPPAARARRPARLHPAASRSPRPGTPTRTPTSSPAAMATAATRWAC